MTLQSIFNEHPNDKYLKAIHQGIFHKPFLAKRRVQPFVSADEIEFIKELLSKENEKWFVADYLRYMESMPDALLMPVLLTGLKEKDPSYDRYFVRPCVRMYGCIEILDRIELLYDNDKTLGLGTLSLLYYVRSLFAKVGRISDNGVDKWQTIGMKLFWNEEKGSYDWSFRDKDKMMTEAEFEAYKPTHESYLQKKRALIEKVAAENSSLSNLANHMLGQLS